MDTGQEERRRRRYEVCTVLTEVNPTLNLDILFIALNDCLNLESFWLSIRYLYTGDWKGVYVNKLSWKWMIKLDTDKTKLDATTQLVIRSSENLSLAQIFNMNDPVLRHNCVTSDSFIDTLFADNTTKSKRQFICALVFVTDFCYNHILPMNSKKYFHHAMKHF